MNACIKYVFEDSVLAYAKRRGLLQSLHTMLEQSARHSHALGNRRYHDFVFAVEDGLVLRMSNLVDGSNSNYLPVLKNDEFVVYETCESCDGDGCDKCEDEGEVPVIRKIPKQKTF